MRSAYSSFIRLILLLITFGACSILAHAEETTYKISAGENSHTLILTPPDNAEPIILTMTGAEGNKPKYYADKNGSGLCVRYGRTNNPNVDFKLVLSSPLANVRAVEYEATSNAPVGLAVKIGDHSFFTPDKRNIVCSESKTRVYHFELPEHHYDGSLELCFYVSNEFWKLDLQNLKIITD